MSFISRFKGTNDDNDGVPPRQVGDRLLDRLTTSTYLLPIVIIGGAIWYLGYNPLYIGALAAGVVVWAYWGRRMTMSDGKLALVVNVETGEIAPYVIGRSRWARAEKIGRPYLSFRTPRAYLSRSCKTTTPTVTLSHIHLPALIRTSI